MSPKDRTISLRVTDDWIAAADEAAKRASRKLPPSFGALSRTDLIDMAVIGWYASEGWDDLVELAAP